jgi:hypothetical protein
VGRTFLCFHAAYPNTCLFIVKYFLYYAGERDGATYRRWASLRSALRKRRLLEYLHHVLSGLVTGGLQEIAFTSGLERCRNMTRTGMETTVSSKDSIMEPLLTVEQLAVMVKRSHWTLRRDVKAGLIRCVRIGRAIRIEAVEARRIMNEGLALSKVSPK